MRLDPKYFNRFIFFAALFGAVLIVIFTVWQQESREKTFKRQLSKHGDSLSSRYLKQITSDDSLRIKQFEDQWVLLDFWATWAPPSRQSHKILHRLKKDYKDELVVVSAASQDPIREIEQYIKTHQYPFYFVEGRKLYKELHPPGVPTQIVYGPDGDIQFTVLGYQDSTQYRPLIEGLNRSNQSVSNK